MSTYYEVPGVTGGLDSSFHPGEAAAGLGQAGLELTLQSGQLQQGGTILTRPATITTNNISPVIPRPLPALDLNTLTTSARQSFGLSVLTQYSPLAFYIFNTA